MPNPETVRGLDLGKALLLAFTGTDRFGEVIVSDEPVELDVRWEPGEKEIVDSNGSTITIDATVFVNQDITIGSLMWQGGLDDLEGTASLPTTDLFKVVAFNKTPDVKNRYFQRDVSLVRFKNSLPETS